VWCRLYHENQQIKIEVIPYIQAPDMVSVSADDLYNGPIYDDDREGE